METSSSSRSVKSDQLIDKPVDKGKLLLITFGFYGFIALLPVQCFLNTIDYYKLEVRLFKTLTFVSSSRPNTHQRPRFLSRCTVSWS